jgi:hypothetical protein
MNVRMKVLLMKEEKSWLSTEIERPHNEVIHTYLICLSFSQSQKCICSLPQTSYVSKLLKYMREAISNLTVLGHQIAWAFVNMQGLSSRGVLSFLWGFSNSQLK